MAFIRSLAVGFRRTGVHPKLRNARPVELQTLGGPSSCFLQRRFQGGLPVGPQLPGQQDEAEEDGKSSKRKDGGGGKKKQDDESPSWGTTVFKMFESALTTAASVCSAKQQFESRESAC